MAAVSVPKLTFPLPSAAPYIIPGNAQQTAIIKKDTKNQYIAFYHHCLFYKQKSPQDYRPLLAYHLDLTAKDVCWEEKGVSMKALKVVVACSALAEKKSIDQWTFTIDKKGEKTQKEFFLSADKIIPVRSFSFPYFKGDEYEITYFAANGPGLISPLKAEQWDTWRFDSNVFVIDFRNNIYPLFETGLKYALSYLDGRALTLLDIGGHDGELSLRLIEKFTQIEKVYLADISHRAIEEIKHHKEGNFDKDEKKCECYETLSSFYSKIEPFESDLRTVDFEKEITQGKKVDIILISGVAAWGILTREESSALFKKCPALLKDDGFIFVASASNPHFTKEDYQGFGYEVLNTSASKIYKLNGNFQVPFRPFYVLRKNNLNVKA